MAGGLFVLPKMHKITQNSLLKKHGIFYLTFSSEIFCIFVLTTVFFSCIIARRKQRRSGEHRNSPPAVCEEVHNFLRFVRKSGFYVRVLCGIRTLHLEVLYNR